MVVAEGCKAADAAGELLPGFVHVSWPGGGNGVSRADWSALKGRDVVVWPDRDRQHHRAPSEQGAVEMPYDEQPGTIAADAIAAKLRRVAKSVRVLDLEQWDCSGGWDAADALAAGWTTNQAAAFVEKHAKLVDPEARGTTLPPGFEYREDGLYFAQAGGDTMKVAGRIRAIARTRDASGNSWGLLLRWYDQDGREHRWAMPATLLAGDGSDIRVELLNRGLYVPQQPKARAKLNEFLATVDTGARARAVTKVGWAGDAFALPHLTVGDTPADRVIFQHPDSSEHNYGSAGTLESWQQNVGQLAVGNSRLAFMISTAFVGPILRLQSEEGGGVNVVGSSSTGKTTGLRAAASVWGPPAFIRQWRATSNGLEGIAAAHNETFLPLDELSQLDPREAGPTAYMLSNGQGKSRASRSGAARIATTWKVIYLSTGEVGLAGLMIDARQARAPMAGQEVRILDVPADAGKGMGLFEALHGEPSPEALAPTLESVIERFDEFVRSVVQSYEQGGTARDVMDSLKQVGSELGSVLGTLAPVFKTLAQNAKSVATALEALATVMTLRYVGGIAAAVVGSEAVQTAIFAISAAAGGAATTLEALGLVAAATGRALLAAFGGPVGIAVAALTFGVYELLTATNQAADATGKFKDVQDQAKESAEKTKTAIDDLATAHGEARKKVEEEAEAHLKNAEAKLKDAEASAALAQAEVQRAKVRLDTENKRATNGPAYAEQSAGAAYKAVAGIPVVGPVLAPAAAAAAFVAVMAFSAAGGMDNVPYDNAPFLLHKNEMVLSAPIAEGMRSIIANGGAAGEGAATGWAMPDLSGMKEMLKSTAASFAQMGRIMLPDSTVGSLAMPQMEMPGRFGLPASIANGLGSLTAGSGTASGPLPDGNDGGGGDTHYHFTFPGQVVSNPGELQRWANKNAPALVAGMRPHIERWTKA